MKKRYGEKVVKRGMRKIERTRERRNIKKGKGERV
jgi:hypothetical protein